MSHAETGRFERLFSTAVQDAKRAELPVGVTIHEPSTLAESVYYIHSGQVRIYQLGPDGESGSADRDPRRRRMVWRGSPRPYAHVFDASGHGDAVVLSEVPADKWHAALASTPEIAAEVIGQLARKLQAAQEDAGRLVFDDCNQRLVKTLLRFSHTAAASRRDESGEVVLRITHQQLAQAVGAARETISLALTQLRQRDLLRTGRNQLFFNPEVLREFSQQNGEQQDSLHEQATSN